MNLTVSAKEASEQMKTNYKVFCDKIGYKKWRKWKKAKLKSCHLGWKVQKDETLTTFILISAKKSKNEKKPLNLKTESNKNEIDVTKLKRVANP